MRDIDPDSEESQAMQRQNDREVFALQMQAKQDVENRIAELEAALAWALPMALDWRGSLPPEAWPEFDEDSAQAREALAKSTP